jgi:hypothetical protein
VRSGTWKPKKTIQMVQRLHSRRVVSGLNLGAGLAAGLSVLTLKAKA